MASDAQQQLLWERRQRPRVVVAALIAAIVPLVAGLANAFVYNGAPRANVLTSLERAFEAGPVADLPSLHLELYAFYSERFPLLLSIAVGNAVGLVAGGMALSFLGAATRARRPEFYRWAVYLPVVGALIFAVAELILAVGTNLAVQATLTGARTVAAVAGVDPTLVTVGELLERGGRFLFGVGFVMVCLNAMRCGLLIRFLGVLGVIAGGLFIVPIFGGPLPIVQSFWFVALAIVCSGRWPGATPPAWSSGRAEPWPTQLEVKEARDREQEEAAVRPAKPRRAGRDPVGGTSTATPDGLSEGNGRPAETPPGPARPRTGRNKRKRRR